MNVLFIALNTIKRNFRDKKSLVSSILMPILMIIILGTALSGFFQSTEIDKINICYLNLDGGAFGKEFQSFLNNKEIIKLVNVKEVASLEDGEKLVNDKKAVSMIVIPKDYSYKIKSGKEGKVQIYNTKYTDFKNSMVEEIVDAYNSAGNTMMAVSKINNNISYSRYSNVEENVLSTKGKSPRAIDYYGVAMLVLAIMSSASLAASMVSEDYFDDVSQRIKATPVKAYERLLGKILGCVVDISVKALLIVAFSKLVYKVNWGDNLGMIVVIIICAATFSTIFGMFIAMAVGNGSKASGIINILSNLFTFLAGGYTLILTQDKNISAIMHLSPNFYPQTALLNVIYSNNYSVNVHFFSTFGYISVMLVISAMLFLGFITLERRSIK